MKKSKYLDLILPNKLEKKIERSINRLLVFTLFTLIETVLLIILLITQIYSQFQASSIPFTITIIALIISYIFTFSNLHRINKPTTTKSDSLHIMFYMLNKYINNSNNNISIIKKLKIQLFINQINIILYKIITNLKDVFVPLNITDTESVIKNIQKSLIHINKIELSESNKKEILKFLDSIIKLHEYRLIIDNEIPLVTLHDKSISNYTFKEVITEFNRNFNTLISINESRVEKGFIKSITFYRKLFSILLTIFTISIIFWLWSDDSTLSKVGSFTGVLGLYFTLMFQLMNKNKEK